MIKDRKNISIVIPVFRNEKAITVTFEKLNELFSGLNYEFDIIFINDGSDDGSLEELVLLHNKHIDKIKLISFSRNFGQVAAITAGFERVSGDAVIMMSADLQEPVSLITGMIGEWENGNKIVICHRTDREDSVVANISSSIFYRFMHYVNPKMPRGGFDFLLLDKIALKHLLCIKEKNRFLQGDILWLGFKSSFIPYKRLKRDIGKSQWTLSKKLKYLIDGFISTSHLPIRVMSLMGILFSIAGFLYGGVIVVERILNNSPFQGYAPIMILILITGGLNMLMLGLVGEYLWRIYDESRSRPNFIIDEEYGFDN